MCIIAAMPGGVEMDKDTFKTCWDNNDDGFGMMYVDNGKVVIEKSMIKKVAWRIYNRVRRSHPDSAKVLHFRIGTHGTTDLFNCHPFVIKEGELAFAHNGIITAIADDKEKKCSDTQMFNECVLKHLPTDFYKQSAFVELIANYIGQSKLVFLNSDNEIYIIKKYLGVMEGDIWYSNETYMKSRWTGTNYYGYGSGYVSHKQKTITYTNKGLNSNVYHQCSYCSSWTNDCTNYEEFGYLCEQCRPFLEEVGFEMKPIESATDSLNGEDKTPDADNDWDDWESNNYLGGMCY